MLGAPDAEMFVSRDDRRYSLRETSAPPGTLRLSFLEYSRSAVLALLEWVYTGRVAGEHFAQPAVALEALQLADQLGADAFKALAEAALCAALSEHTAKMGNSKRIFSTCCRSNEAPR